MKFYKIPMLIRMARNIAEYVKRFGVIIMITGQKHPIGKSFLDCGVIDFSEIHPCGLLRVHGWYSGTLDELKHNLFLIVNGSMQNCIFYRVYRPDVAQSTQSDSMYLGFIAEYALHGRIDTLELQISNNQNNTISIPASLDVNDPPYAPLFDHHTVFHRQDIYSSGPPVDVVDMQVLAAIQESIEGKILDFGCGIGTLLNHLRAMGLMATGIELDRPEIRQSIPDERVELIHLYDGALPLPYEDEAFDCITCIEVLEHIHDFQDIVKDLARITKKRLVVSVPDMSSVPLLAQHHVVPWHLLEGTHYNFFTQSSLLKLLSLSFSHVEFARVGPFIVNGTTCYTSLIAFCDK